MDHPCSHPKTSVLLNTTLRNNILDWNTMSSWLPVPLATPLRSKSFKNPGRSLRDAGVAWFWQRHLALHPHMKNVKLVIKMVPCRRKFAVLRIGAYSVDLGVG